MAPRNPTASPQQRKVAAQAKAAESRNRRKPRVEEDTEDDDVTSDLGPWIETPSSTRVRAFRYDYAKRETQVTWRNLKNEGCAYENMAYEDFRAFARIASKGKYINSTLTGGGFRYLTPTEASLPSNQRRRAISSRVRT
jgi:hypothetical protein